MTKVGIPISIAADKKTVLVAACAMLAGLLAGCGGSRETGGTPADNKEKAPEPVTLTLTPYFLNMTDEEYDEVMIKPLKAKYPHITLNINKEDITKLVTAGQTPDIVYGANSRFSVLQDLDLPYDLREFAKTYKVDLNKFASPNIDWIKELGPKGELYALPFALNHMALFYNKDLFDKRGVPYPKDGLFWDEYVDIVKKMTYSEGGVQFRGSLPPNPETFARMKSQPLVDASANKALVNTPQFKPLLELVQQFYQIPGMVVNFQKPPGLDSFFKDQQTAMFMNWIPDSLGLLQKNGALFPFDLVGAPTFRDNPGITIDPGAQLMIVTKTSKHKEEAFKVIEFLTSPDVQTILNKKSRLTALADESIRKDFLSELPLAKGKNIQGALKVKPAKMAPPNPYHVAVAGKVNALADVIVAGTKDINTMLRETQESADKAIAEEAARRQK
ncbi:ABC transporter substrate-binding protein [Paenibacillus sp. GYB003]|uniref:ABC transporter substrate-binding protein n=1 Tax=Paenibacillus sp. GYB003 TaxID=2994392 RepID=UPI002F964B04